ncbi:hypothetical protein ACFXNW_24120 [Nocardia sp. NPDC059180]
MPQSSYPSGYQVAVQGAEVMSEPDARLLELAVVPGQDTVQVTVTRR